VFSTAYNSIKGDGSQVNGLRRLCCEGGVMFLIGLWCVAQSCCVITVFRVACCTLNVSAVGLLTQGVDTASINQSINQKLNFDVTFLLNFSF
jgi:uncharacterized membrane protein YiaA